MRRGEAEVRRGSESSRLAHEARPEGVLLVQGGAQLPKGVEVVPRRLERLGLGVVVPQVAHVDHAARGEGRGGGGEGQGSGGAARARASQARLEVGSQAGGAATDLEGSRGRRRRRARVGARGVVRQVAAPREAAVPEDEGGAWSLQAENPQLWGGLRRAPEATQDAPGCALGCVGAAWALGGTRRADAARQAALSTGWRARQSRGAHTRRGPSWS